jgi:hypothetical protein
MTLSEIDDMSQRAIEALTQRQKKTPRGGRR